MASDNVLRKLVSYDDLRAVRSYSVKEAHAVLLNQLQWVQGELGKISEGDLAASLDITIQFSAGLHIGIVAEQLCFVARKTGCRVRGKFSGQWLTATPASRVDDITEQYWDDLRRRKARGGE